MIHWAPYRLFRNELAMLLRMPSFLVPSMLFPPIIFAFTYLLNHDVVVDDPGFPAYLMGGIAAIGVMGVLFFNYGVGIAAQRASGQLRHLRVTPLHPLAFFASKLAAGFLFAFASVCIVFGLGIYGFRVHPPYNVPSLLAMLGLGAPPFAAMGFALGYWAHPSSASAIANLVYLPMMFLSGLFYRLDSAPQVLRSVAEFLPLTHYARLIRQAMGTSPPRELLTELAVLWVFCGLFAALAFWGYVDDEFDEYR